MDSATDGRKFGAIHFSYYCRNATKADDAPRDAHPLTLKIVGKSRVNYTQMVPYESKELRMHEEEYRNLCSCFQALFEWIEEKLRRFFPGLVKKISVLASSLPGHQDVPAYPFSGFVLNINVATRVHRDGKDLHACLVMPIGEFTGGDLVLVEPGLVLPLRCGDLVFFLSPEISHFNLHFKGMRASLVCHTDREGVVWSQTGNGWNGSSAFDDGGVAG
ncbi:hypothetical protein OH76DRAFT_1353787 [Lentinus brumalis]|uniref:2OGFeDO JBP1/TET oxygenase domain-containing protein n=1 Tax=Lentinus brumalis TaxID=2498619 RepID=A0A371D590_9APHY|nr:hypothetical protein OH76DRAFT_1353787 [Polyporus brumalis]